MSKMSLDSRKITPAFRDQIAAAELETQKFNSMKGDLASKTKKVYKSPKFDLSVEVDELKENNIVDEDWASAVKEDYMPKEPARMEHDALVAAGFEAEAANMEPEVPVQQENEMKKEEGKQEQNKPLTDEEKYALVVKGISDRFGKELLNTKVLQQWKSTYGNIFVLDLGEKNIFIYRYLNRQEWQQLTADPSWTNLNELKQEERIVNKCLLFPKVGPTQKGLLPAGCFSLLSEQIKIQSMFLNPGYVAEITMKI